MCIEFAPRVLVYSGVSCYEYRSELASDSGVVFTEVSLVGEGSVSWHVYFCAPVIVGECFLCGAFDSEVFTGFEGDEFLFVLGFGFDGWFEWDFFVVGSGFVFNWEVVE